MKQMHKTFFALGTVNTVSVSYEENREFQIMEILNHIKTRVLMLNDKLSVFKENSEITRINQQAGKKPAQVSMETMKIIEKSIEISKKSSGAFDITAGKLSRLWRKAIKEKKVPDLQNIELYAQLTNYQDIVLKNNTVGLSKWGQEIDLGGIAKGYAADEAKRILTEEKVSNAIINFGGTILAMGNIKQVGIQNPFAKRGKALGSLPVKNQAVVTSGLYEQSFRKGDCVYHHIINPRTGMPAESGLISVSVIGESALEMDALATAVFIMGLESGIKLVKEYHAEAVFMNEAGNIFFTKGLGGHYK